jgi:hypothetical protein
MTDATADTGLDDDPGTDGVGDAGPLDGNPAYDLMTGDQRIDHVTGLTLPHLDIVSGDPGGFNGEPAPLVVAHGFDDCVGEVSRLDQHHGPGRCPSIHRRRV